MQFFVVTFLVSPPCDKNILMTFEEEDLNQEAAVAFKFEVYCCISSPFYCGVYHFAPFTGMTFISDAMLK